MHTCTNHGLCIDTALREADRICCDRGLRFTALRREVLEMIWASHIPAKAYAILDKLKGRSASARPPTVYRALDFLLQNGLAHKLHSLNAYVGCSHPLRHKGCYFLICRRCGEARECCSNKLDQAITGTASRNRFNLRRVSLEVEGECRECAEREPQEK